MPYTLEDYRKDTARWVLNELTPEEVLTHYKPEKLLAGLTPEQRLAGLTPEERLAGLSAQELQSLSKDLLSKQDDSSAVS